MVQFRVEKKDLIRQFSSVPCPSSLNLVLGALERVETLRTQIKIPAEKASPLEKRQFKVFWIPAECCPRPPPKPGP